MIEKMCDRYTELLQDIPGIKLLDRLKNVKSNYAYYPILIEEEYGLTRDEVCDKLAKNEIYARKYFYPIVTEYSCYKGKYGFTNDSVAKDVSMKVICLPLYDTMNLSVVNQICSILSFC